jgi:hypothetical protein
MSTLSLIRLELGRTEEFPQGSRQHGYEFVAPLTKEGHVDAAAWRETKKRCWVRRFWGRDRDEHGMLKHVGHGWRFDYGFVAESDEPFFKLDQHAFAAGNYVSIREHDGVTRPFRVTYALPVSMYELAEPEMSKSPEHTRVGALFSADGI